MLLFLYYSMSTSTHTSVPRQIYPLARLNPYQGNWTIKVRVTSKGHMRHYNNTRGEGCVFSVELTDDDGTQIQAIMFNAAARKFFELFDMGKVYYISGGYLKRANKQYNRVDNDYEMTLNENSQVEEAVNEPIIIPTLTFSFVPIDQLGPYVQQKELIDVIGVVQHVSSTMSIRRKADNESVPKRDITIADDTMKSMIVSLWGPLATGIGSKLLDMFDASPIVAIKSLRVSDFGGLTLSTITKTIIEINPNSHESQKLKTWYASEGSVATFESVGSTFRPGHTNDAPSMYSDRVGLEYITNNPSLGESTVIASDNLSPKVSQVTTMSSNIIPTLTYYVSLTMTFVLQPVYYTTRACMSFIKDDQAMYYRTCKTCNKKLTVNVGSAYSFLICRKTQTDPNFRYVVSAKFSDASGEAWMSLFADEAETIIGCSAADLDIMKSKPDGSAYQTQLKKAKWVPHVFRVMVALRAYNNDRRQRITVKIVSLVDYAGESKYLLNEISSTQS
ncbi:replication protein A 70 kDa DNA-binding subunit B-like isoform X2 [Bidens hawaiensis]|uniref:replication protein A 70 kDa DNA-binding subunit B-like isoform X2 n=1 Tax=Bidens hawaiensis TaxID=980011 RepID=UPI004048ED66